MNRRIAASRATLASLTLLALGSAGCQTSPATAPGAASTTPSRAEVTLLFTSDEHGWLLPRTENGRVRGGAAEMLGRWIATEGHCPGPPSPPCKDPGTLAISAGDNYTGPAISTYFDGLPMAEAMARMGYAASAFGNHELDFGREHFLADRARSGVVYLAANLRAPETRQDMALPPFAIFERRGLKIGVVGVASSATLRMAMASHFEGITFESEEPAMDRGVRGAWAAGADAVVVLIHECPDRVAPIVERHPEWKLSFVGAGHCHKMMSLRAGGVPVIGPGWRLDRYVRVRLTASPGPQGGARKVSADEPVVVEMSRPEGPATTPPDAEIARAAEVWRAKVDAVLGEEIGFSTTGFAKESPLMGRWIAGAWREELGTDLAIVNGSGLRQALSPGPITKATLWSILPFDNRTMVVRVDGATLAENLRNKAAVVVGATRGPDGTFTFADGKAIDPARIYTVAMPDFLYLGGDHFTFEKRAASAEDRGDWREMAIAWTRKQRTTKDAPLETRLR
jgi:2',3'-cyclic-nucleotide 2'-phosphodiesterase (5'-nucleotidase family)